MVLGALPTTDLPQWMAKPFHREQIKKQAQHVNYPGAPWFSQLVPIRVRDQIGVELEERQASLAVVPLLLRRPRPYCKAGRQQYSDGTRALETHSDSPDTIISTSSFVLYLLPPHQPASLPK